MAAHCDDVERDREKGDAAERAFVAFVHQGGGKVIGAHRKIYRAEGCAELPNNSHGDIAFLTRGGLRVIAEVKRKYPRPSTGEYGLEDYRLEGMKNVAGYDEKIYAILRPGDLTWIVASFDALISSGQLVEKDQYSYRNGVRREEPTWFWSANSWSKDWSKYLDHREKERPADLDTGLAQALDALNRRAALWRQQPPPPTPPPSGIWYGIVWRRYFPPLQRDEEQA